MLELSADLRKKVLPWRGGPYPLATVDLKKVGARLQEVRNLEALTHAFLTAAVAIDPPFKKALDERIAGPIAKPAALVPEVEAAMLCLLGANDHAWDRSHQIGADLVHFWCALGSAEVVIWAWRLKG